MADKATILVADDDTLFVKALSIRLKQAGYEVITATDGYFAVQQVAEHQPDLLVLDIHMPAGDGFTVQQRKDNMSHLAGVPVVYVSGDKSDEAKAAAEAIGSLGLIHKPFEFEQLLEVIETALASPAS